MNTDLKMLSVQALRSSLIMESKKFIWALELGATVNDLEHIRQVIRDISDVLKTKEDRNEEKHPQKNSHNPINEPFLTQKGNGI